MNCKYCKNIMAPVADRSKYLQYIFANETISFICDICDVHFICNKENKLIIEQIYRHNFFVFLAHYNNITRIKSKDRFYVELPFVIGANNPNLTLDDLLNKIQTIITFQ